MELFWLGDAGRVEDEGGVLAVTGVAGQVVVRIQQGGDRVDQAALTTDEHEARQRWLAGLVAAQLLGLRQTDLVSQEVAERGLDELAVTVGVLGGSLRHLFSFGLSLSGLHVTLTCCALDAP